MTSVRFQSIDWYGYDVDVNAVLNEDSDSDDEQIKKKQKKLFQYVIKVFGRTMEGETVSLNVMEYKPYFFVKVQGTLAKTTSGNAVCTIKQRLNGLMPWWAKNELESVKEVIRKEYWGFTNNEPRSFIKLTFKTHKAMRAAINLIDREELGLKLKLFESNIEPFLRFMHFKNLQPCGWIQVPSASMNSEEHVLPSECDIQMSCNYKDINRYECDKMAPFVIASFDIECTSSHGDFPQAKKGYKKTAAEVLTMISILSKTKSPSQIHKEIKNALLYAFDLNPEYGEDECHEYVKNVYCKKKPSNEELENLITKVSEEIYLIAMNRIRLGDDLKPIRPSPFAPKPPQQSGKKEIVDGAGSDDEENEDTKFKKLFSGSSTSSINPSKNITAANTNFQGEETVTSRLTRYLDKIFPALRGDPIIQIGTTLHKYGERSIYKKHILTLDTCDPLEGIIVESCKTERELLKKWVQFIKSENPDILTGYNILGFDMQYMYDRSDELGRSSLDLMCSLSRIEGLPIVRDGKKPEMNVKKLASSALGENLLKSLPMDGRISIDMLKVIQREYKLDLYKLDFVASNFIKGKVTKVSPPNRVIIDNPTGIVAGNFIYLADHKYEIMDLSGNEITTTENIKDESLGVSWWGLAKDDVTPQEIFECQYGTSADRARIAKYCVMDCALCNYLMMKLEVIANNVGMCNVCTVPLAFIFMRGQGIKVFSLLAKQCKEEGFLIPTLSRNRIRNENGILTEDAEENIGNDDGGYEGAIVLTPQPGIYVDDPVAVLDYGSLYPSSMISENISHDSIVLDQRYNNLPGYSYEDISYDMEDSSGNKTTKVVRFAQPPNGEKSVLPRILQTLLGQRSATRKKITFKTVTMKDGTSYTGIYKTDTTTTVSTLDKKVFQLNLEDIVDVKDTYNEFQKAVLDGLQLAYKVTANSLYGSLGAKTSQIYMKELAASTTATGRNLILKAKDFIENDFGGKVVYGDSVVGDTPTVIRQDKKIVVCSFEHIVPKNAVWTSCRNDSDKETFELDNTYVLTDEGWVKVHRVIRHHLAPHKKVVRVSTRNGSVDVTDDHSLFTPSGSKISPKDLSPGNEILHIGYEQITDLHQQEENIGMGMTRAEAQIIGFFGNFGNLKDSWNIKHLDHEVIEKYMMLCKVVYGNNFQMRMSSDSGYRIEQYVSLGLSAHYKKHFYNEYLEKVVPIQIINGCALVKDAFLKGVCDKMADTDGVVRISLAGKLYAQGVYYIASSIGVYVEFGTEPTDLIIYPNTFKVDLETKKLCSEVKTITHIEYEGYVYDFTTDNHKFIAGIGGIIASNTDSVFCTFPKNLYTSDDMNHVEKIRQTIALAQKAEHQFQKFLKPPHVLEYEKTAYPFIIFSKKRYVYNKYDTDPTKYKQTSMGIALKRRDYANIVKIVYGGVIDIILNEQDIIKSKNYLVKSLKDLSEGKYGIEELIITKTLKADYSDPTRIAHKVLADRMRERDAGSAPNINERVPYAYVITEPNKRKRQALLQGNRIENPDYIRKNRMKLDYEFYITNQIMKPCMQIFALPGVLEKIRTRHSSNARTRELEVKEILFDPILQDLDNKETGQRLIADFLVKE